MALPNGTVRSTDQTLPFFTIGLPVTHVSGPPKSPRSSTDVSPLNGYVIVWLQRFSASGQTNGFSGPLAVAVAVAAAETGVEGLRVGRLTEVPVVGLVAAAGRQRRGEDTPRTERKRTGKRAHRTAGDRKDGHEAPERGRQGKSRALEWRRMAEPPGLSTHA